MNAAQHQSHQEQMEAIRRDFDSFWSIEWTKLRNLGWEQWQETKCRVIAWRAFLAAKGVTL